jgi:NAD(P)H-nitrite reductase large subunit
MLERTLREQGIDVRCGRTTTSIHEDRVRLAGGEEIETDLVIVAAGVVPETELARRAGIEVGRGVLVDDSLRTSVPGIWAVGECAEHRGALVGLAAPALAMARAAGADIAGTPSAYLPGPASTRLKVAGVDLFCAGALEGADELVALDTRAGRYRREVYSDGRLTGAILLGDTTHAPSLTEQLRTGVVPDADADLLICACNGVSRSTILACGASDLEGVQRATRAATGCGGCAGAVEGLLREAAEVGFQAVQLEPAEAIEVLVRRPVEVRRAGRQ